MWQEKSKEPKKNKVSTSSKSSSSKKKNRLSFKEKRELEQLPQKIEDKESAHEALSHELSDPMSYKDPKFDARAKTLELEKLDAEILALYERWEQLSEADL